MRFDLLMTVCLILSTAASAPARSQTSRPPQGDEARVLQLDEEWVAAEDKHDEAALRRMLDDRFLATDEGETLEKDAYIREALRASTAQTLVHSAIRLHGDTAIVVDTDTVKTRAGRKETVEKYRCTVVFVKKQDAWRVVAQQCDSSSSRK